MASTFLQQVHAGSHTGKLFEICASADAFHVSNVRLKHSIERVVCGDNVFQLYSGGDRFESRQGHQLSRPEVFVIFLNLSMRMSR
jgi:hypothetical protein